MKTRPVKVQIDVPTLEAIVAGLTLNDVHPELAIAMRMEHEAAERLANARADIVASEQERERLANETARTGGSTALLEAALTRLEAKRLLVPRLEKALEDAKVAYQQAQSVAQQRLRDEALRRSQLLVQAGAALTPALEEIRALDAQLHRHVLSLLGSASLASVLWPQSPAHEFPWGR